jgi:hypothetical protein
MVKKLSDFNASLSTAQSNSVTSFTVSECLRHPAVHTVEDFFDRRNVALHLSGPEDAPINIFHRLLKEIDRQMRGLPDHLKEIL